MEDATQRLGLVEGLGFFFSSGGVVDVIITEGRLSFDTTHFIFQEALTVTSQ